jgi:Ca2+-binding RTX toxin-like protein
VWIFGNTITNNGVFADNGAEIQIGDNLSDIAIVANRLGSSGSTDYVTGVNLGTVTFEGNRYERGFLVTNLGEPLTIADDPAVVGAMSYYSWGSPSNSINYDAGRQYVRGNGGNDTVSTGADNDGLLGNTGDDQLNGGSGNDGLWGGTGNDTLDGGTGADKMQGGQGDDVFVVDNAGDMVFEGFNSGVDMVQSSVSFSLSAIAHVENVTLTGSGAINATGNGANNVLNGNGGANTLSAAAGNDSVSGNNGHDTISGGTGQDTLSGGAGNDQIAGNGGADLILGGGGLDVLTGGSGSDTFDFNSVNNSGVGNGNRTIITDFTASSGSGDLIDVSDIDADYTIAGNQAYAWIGTAAFSAASQARYEVQGGKIIVMFNNNANLGAEMEIELSGTPPLSAADFIL